MVPTDAIRTALNMRKLSRLSKSRIAPVTMSYPLVQVRVATANIPDVAFEVLYINRIEADDCRVETHICLGNVLAIVVRTRRLGKLSFCAVERGEEDFDVLLVRILRGGEAGFVDAVVDVVVGPFVGGFDCLLETIRQQVDFCVLLGEKVVKGVVEHADDLARLVVDDAFLLGVIEGWDCETAAVIFFVLKVELADVSELWMDRVRSDAVAWCILVVFSGEAPSCSTLSQQTGSPSITGLTYPFPASPNALT